MREGSDRPPRDGRDECSPPDAGADTAETRYRRIFRYSNDAIMVVDLETERIVDVNPATCELLGYSRAELLGMDPGEIHPGEMDAVREEFLSSVVETGFGFTDELTCLTKQGTERPTEISGAALDREGEEPPQRMVAMLRDVSERVRYQQELEARVDRLDRFAETLVHEIRNPLSLVLGHLQQATEGKSTEHLDQARRAARRIDDLIDEMLELARTGTAVGAPTAVDLEEAARRAWNRVDDSEATLRLTTDRTVAADEGRLIALLGNLFENAIDHTDGEVSVHVGELEAERGFFVADDGSGIPADERERIREWGWTDSETGTGYGLAIVGRIVEAHGWTLDVTEAESGGARFEIRVEGS
jgi:PAS domain S-box-containing protein